MFLLSKIEYILVSYIVSLAVSKVIQTVWDWHTNNPKGYAIIKVS